MEAQKLTNLIPLSENVELADLIDLLRDGRVLARHPSGGLRGVVIRGPITDKPPAYRIPIVSGRADLRTLWFDGEIGNHNEFLTYDKS